VAFLFIGSLIKTGLKFNYMRTSQQPGGPTPKNRKPGVDPAHRQRKPSEPSAPSREARAGESNREASHSSKPVTNQDEQRKVTNADESEEEVEDDTRPYHRSPAANFAMTRKAPR
jgi:hypothetical protein